MLSPAVHVPPSLPKLLSGLTPHRVHSTDTELQFVHILVPTEDSSFAYSSGILTGSLAIANEPPGVHAKLTI